MFRLSSFYRHGLTLLVILSFAATSINAFAIRASASTIDDFIPTPLRAQIAGDADRFVNSATDYVKDWSKIPVLLNELEKENGALSAAEKAKLENLANSLKQQIRNMQSSLGSVIQKLRDGNKFTPELDSYINAYLKSKGGSASQALSYIEQENNTRGLLNSANQLFSAQITKIEGIVRDASIVSPRGTASAPASNRLFVSLAHAGAPAKSSRFVCAVLTFKLIVKVLKGTDTTQDSNEFKEECRDVTN
jgi:hypothetical protein